MVAGIKSAAPMVGRVSGWSGWATQFWSTVDKGLRDRIPPGFTIGFLMVTLFKLLKFIAQRAKKVKSGCSSQFLPMCLQWFRCRSQYRYLHLHLYWHLHVHPDLSPDLYPELHLQSMYLLISTICSVKCVCMSIFKYRVLCADVLFFVFAHMYITNLSTHVDTCTACPFCLHCSLLGRAWKKNKWWQCQEYNVLLLTLQLTLEYLKFSKITARAEIVTCCHSPTRMFLVTTRELPQRSLVWSSFVFAQVHILKGSAHVLVVRALMPTLPVHAPHVCHCQETGLSPQAHTHSRTLSASTSRRTVDFIWNRFYISHFLCKCGDNFPWDTAVICTYCNEFFYTPPGETCKVSQKHPPCRTQWATPEQHISKRGQKGKGNWNNVW